MFSRQIDIDINTTRVSMTDFNVFLQVRHCLKTGISRLPRYLCYRCRTANVHHIFREIQEAQSGNRTPNQQEHQNARKIRGRAIGLPACSHRKRHPGAGKCLVLRCFRMPRQIQSRNVLRFTGFRVSHQPRHKALSFVPFLPLKSLHSCPDLAVYCIAHRRNIQTAWTPQRLSCYITYS